MMADRPVILAGVPASNGLLYKKMRHQVHDMVVLIELPGRGSHLILRDIEMERARAAGAADQVHCPADYEPADGLSGDRDTANAQAAAELLTRSDIHEIWTDRTLPALFIHVLGEAGVRVRCDPQMGLLERRVKSDEEVEHLRVAQRDTEAVIQMACRLIASASVDAGGALRAQGEPLTCERVRSEIQIDLLRRGYEPTPPIVACGPAGADCHNMGSGPIRTAEPVIIDVFPRSSTTLFCGDCTRTVVHGEPVNIPPLVIKMHESVVKAKQAAIEATRAGVTGEQVHGASCASLQADGYSIGLPAASAPDDYVGFVHGTGHGIGVDVHEPPLLDVGGPPLVAGDALTIEPGLYSHAVGGIRIEDMVIVRDGGCENLNALPEGLTWLEA